MERKFRFLRFFSVIIKIVAWIILIGSFIAPPFIIGAIAAINAASGQPATPTMGILETGYIWALVVFFGVIHFLVLYAFSELVLVLLAVEENTRATAAGPPAAAPKKAKGAS